MTPIRFVLPIHTVSESNMREHWRARHRRRRDQRLAVSLLLASVEKPSRIPRRVVLARIAPRRLDSDNLAGSLKAVRDEIAVWIGVNDGDQRVTWEYAQRRGKSGEHAVEVTIR